MSILSRRADGRIQVFGITAPRVNLAPSGAGLQTVRRLLLELLVVSIGVSAAFVVEDWRQNKQRQERALQIAQALTRDLEDFIGVTKGFVEEVDRGLADFASAKARGEQPAPFLLRIPGSEKPPVGVWQAVISSGAADVLNATLLSRLAFFYSEIDGVGNRYARYNAFSEEAVLPRVRSGSPAFYTREGELEPSLAAHMDRLVEIRTWMAAHIETAARLSADLEQEMARLRDQ